MKRIALLTGGTSSERDIALRSANNVVSVLSGAFAVDVFDFPSQRDNFLATYGTYDAVIPVLHGVHGEDGTIQGFLETLGVPYVFSGVQAHAIAMDKDVTKVLVAERGIRTPESIVVRSGESVTYDHPVVVKPHNGGSSVATACARSQNELDDALRNALQYSDRVLVEDCILGDEYTVAVVDIAQTPTPLPVIAIRPKDGFFDFESKYNTSALAEEICPAPISEDLAAALQVIALTAHTALGCRHVSRTDILVDGDGVCWFLEINTIPGMTETSLLPKALRASGNDFADVLSSWVHDVLV